MSEILGCDISKWQGLAGKDFDIEKMWESGFRFVILKASQGADVVDKCFLANYQAFRSSPHPWGLGAYHFTTNDNALAQARLFRNCTDTLELNLGLYQDVEFYTASMDYKLRHVDPGLMTLEVLDNPDEIVPVVEFRYTEGYYVGLAALYSYSITSEAIVDVIARQLAGLHGQKESRVYTNGYSGNTVFRNPVMARLPLWVAHWPAKGQTLSRPTLPNVWKQADKWLIWQQKVDAGADHGVPGSLDHDAWGNLEPFPGEPEPPPADGWAVTFSVTKEDGSIVTGKTVLK